MDNNLKKLREKAGLSLRQLAAKVGATKLEIQRIESNLRPAELVLAKRVCSVLDSPIDKVFPGASSAIAAYFKELEGPTHVSSETYRLLRNVGLEGDSRSHILKVRLRGHSEPMFFDISAGEADRVFRRMQSEPKDEDENHFIVFDTDRLRVAMNLRSAMFCHFLWDANIGIRVEDAETDDDEFNAVRVYFGEDLKPTILSAEAENDDIESDRNYLNIIFYLLDGGAESSQRLFIEDADGEGAFLRVGDISLLTAPLMLLDPNEWADEDDDET